jgi:F-type H+-transporting ATPase subunit b
MKVPGIRRKRYCVITYVMAVLLFCFVGVALGSSEVEHEAEAKGWVATDTYRIMNFAVLAGGLFYLLRKPASKALGDRINGIKEQLSELEAKKKGAEEKLAEYNKKLSQLDQEAEKLVEEYIRQGNEAKARILKEAESAAEKLEAQARRNIEHEFKTAKLKLQEEILERALAKAEEIVKSKITTKDQDRLIDEYIEKVVA